MSKPMSNKKMKVPKLTEAEYAAYISSLREGEEVAVRPSTDEKKAPSHTLALKDK